MSVKFSFHAEKHVRAIPRLPRAVSRGDCVAVFSPSSPAGESRMQKGMEELRALGFSVEPPRRQQNDGYFASTAEARRAELLDLLRRNDVAALFALRGGYGANYILEGISVNDFSPPKCIVGFSDLTTLQTFLWQQLGWVSFYGPMVAAGLDAGADAANGYDRDSLLNALARTGSGWNLNLAGEAPVKGNCEGRLLGGAMTLVEATLGTPWELNTDDSILLLEDRAMKPYQVDRVLMHLKQAGKFKGVRGIILGEFPECDPPVAGSPTVREVCERILAPLRIPTVFGAAVGHTPRPMLTLPLGVRAHLEAQGTGTLEILEPAVTA
jgi:muramoyltetrapeptide carboxypeptidase